MHPDPSRQGDSARPPSQTRTRTRTHTHTHTHTHTRTHLRTHTHRRTHPHTNTHTHIHTHAHAPALADLPFELRPCARASARGTPSALCRLAPVPHACQDWAHPCPTSASGLTGLIRSSTGLAQACSFATAGLGAACILTSASTHTGPSPRTAAPGKDIIYIYIYIYIVSA